MTKTMTAIAERADMPQHLSIRYADGMTAEPVVEAPGIAPRVPTGVLHVIPDEPSVLVETAPRPLFDSNVFQREEKKYLITQDTYEALRNALGDRVTEDAFGISHICSLYLDTPEHLLIRQSLEKPVYKEKIRIRSYGVPRSFDDSVFLEIKKKFKGVVYKRRVQMTAREVLSFWSRGAYPATALNAVDEFGQRDESKIARNRQILDELDWTFSRYSPLTASMNVSCDRLALVACEDPHLRITFDANARWSEHGIGKLPGDGVNPLLPDDMYIMEVKFVGALPMWMSHLLNDLDILPQSFSKYGTAYQHSDACLGFNEQLGA